MIGLSVIIGLLVGTLALVRNKQTLETGAAAGNAKIFLSPEIVSVSSPTDLQVWLTADATVAFARVEITFDPALLKLTQEVSTGGIPLTRLIKVTPMSEANTSGKITLIAGLDPANRANPPTGTFKLATFTVTPKTTNPNVPTTVSIDKSLMEVVNPNVTLFNLTTANSSLTLNPVGVPGDVNGDGHVTATDMGIILDNYGLVTPLDPRADLDHDGKVTIIDVGILIDNYGR